MGPSRVPLVLATVAALLGTSCVGASGPLEVIDAAGKLKREDLTRFVSKQLKPVDRGT